MSVAAAVGTPISSCQQSLRSTAQGLSGRLRHQVSELAALELSGM
jgi:hypothetical protein